MFSWAPGHLLSTLLSSLGEGLSSHEGNKATIKALRPQLERVEKELEITQRGRDLLEKILKTSEQPNPGNESLAAWFADRTWNLSPLPSDMKSDDFLKALETARDFITCQKCGKDALVKVVTYERVSSESGGDHWKSQKVRLCKACFSIYEAENPRTSKKPFLVGFRLA